MKLDMNIWSNMRAKPNKIIESIYIPCSVTDRAYNITIAFIFGCKL